VVNPNCLGDFPGLSFNRTRLFTTCSTLCLRHRGRGIRGAVQSLESRDRNLMLIGRVLPLGCSFTAENAPYRDIYYLFILPGVQGLWRVASSAAARRRLKLLTRRDPFLTWGPFFRVALEQGVAAFGLATIYANAYLLLRETFWWWEASIPLVLFVRRLSYGNGCHSSRRKSRNWIEGKAVTVPDHGGRMSCSHVVEHQRGTFHEMLYFAATGALFY
jgi:hypothetical protein